MIHIPHPRVWFRGDRWVISTGLIWLVLSSIAGLLTMLNDYGMSCDAYTHIYYWLMVTPRFPVTFFCWTTPILTLVAGWWFLSTARGRHFGFVTIFVAAMILAWGIAGFSSFVEALTMPAHLQTLKTDERTYHLASCFDIDYTEYVLYECDRGSMVCERIFIDACCLSSDVRLEMDGENQVRVLRDDDVMFSTAWERR